MAKKSAKKRGPKKKIRRKVRLRENYARVQTMLAGQLEFANGSISHSGTKGAVNEENWIDLLRQYLPRRYACDTGIIIDSEGNVSDQIDIVIFDPQYTPLLLGQKSHRYIPAEAVYTVIESKPVIDTAMLKYAGEKAESVRRLKRTSVDITHAASATSAKAKVPFPIPAGIVAKGIGWRSGLGVEFQAALAGLTGDRALQFGCAADGAAFSIVPGVSGITTHSDSTSVMWFLFGLLDRLQRLGTVTAIDWRAYSAVLKPS